MSNLCQNVIEDTRAEIPAKAGKMKNATIDGETTVTRQRIAIDATDQDTDLHLLVKIGVMSRGSRVPILKRSIPSVEVWEGIIETRTS